MCESDEGKQERDEAIEGIRRGLESAAHGEGRADEDVLNEFRAQHGFPGNP